MEKSRNGGRQKGYVHNDETKKKIFESNPNKISVKCPHGEFNSVKEASRATGHSVGMINYFCMRGEQQREGTAKVGTTRRGTELKDYREWFKSESGPKILRKCITPHGVFDSLAAAARAENISTSAIHHKINTGREGYGYA